MFSSSIKQVLKTPTVKRSIISNVRPSTQNFKLATYRVSSIRNYSGGHDEETFEEFTKR